MSHCPQKLARQPLNRVREGCGEEEGVAGRDWRHRADHAPDLRLEDPGIGAQGLGKCVWFETVQNDGVPVGLAAGPFLLG